MKALVVYVSVHHGNTEKIAKAIAHVLGARLAKADEIKPEEASEFDMIGFGSGIYNGRHHASLMKLAEEANLKGKRVFFFSTAGAQGLAGIYSHRPLRSLLNRKGATILGEFSAPGFDTYGVLGKIGGMNKGRPNESDIRKAEEFARMMREKYKGRAAPYFV